jgi:opacity protein-like surface antigen
MKRHPSHAIVRRAALSALTLFAVTAAAPADAGNGGLGLGIGVVTLEEQDEKSMFLTGNIRFTLLGPILLEPELGYWKEEHEGILAGTESEDLSLGVNALVMLPPDGPVQVFGGVGIGAHFIDRSARVGGILAQVDDTRRAIHLLAGIEFKTSGPLAIFGTIRRDTFRDEDDEPHQTKFYGGLRFRF